MKLHNQAAVAADPAEVFALLNDPERIVGCLPGARLTGREGEAWAGGVTVKVGPISVSYTGTVVFDQVDDAARSLRLVARGSDSKGSGDAEADVALRVDPGPDGGCVLDIDTDLLIRGKLAQFGKGAIATVSDKILQQFARNLGALATDGVPDVPSPTTPPPAPADPVPIADPTGDLDGWALIAGPLIREHGRRVAVVGLALLQGYVLGRAVTIERFYRRTRR